MMTFRIASWRPVHLLIAWCAYWAALVFLTIGPALPSIWRVTRPDARGNISASFGDGVMKLVVSEGAQVAWTRDLRFAAILAAIGIPPLLLWALWLYAQRGRRRTEAADVKAGL